MNLLDCENLEDAEVKTREESEKQGPSETSLAMH